MKVQVGEKIPDFHAIDDEGNSVSSGDLQGAVSVLYFYPKDDTPGCTKEACEFRDHIEEFNTRGAVLIGISPDPGTSHVKFIKKYKLNFCLLCDPEFQIAAEFGIVKKHDGEKSIERSTFLVDERGIIQWIESPVQIENHVLRVIKAIDGLS